MRIIFELLLTGYFFWSVGKLGLLRRRNTVLLAAYLKAVNEHGKLSTQLKAVCEIVSQKDVELRAEFDRVLRHVATTRQTTEQFIS